MNKDFALIVFKRFGKGLLAAIGAAALQFTLSHLPAVEQSLPSIINSPILLMVATAALLALDKYLQGYKIQ